MTISTYNTEKGTFYIQSKGLNAGRPLKTPMVNSFVVKTDIKNAYEIVYSLWKSNVFEKYIVGSVIPFIKIKDVKNIVLKAIENSELYDENKLNELNRLDLVIDNANKKIQLIKQMQKVLATHINKEVNLS
tara:strand:- start:550 stop:942 length:393 start_codon:yes stop_codon:yes gene_type:complete